MQKQQRDESIVLPERVRGQCSFSGTFCATNNIPGNLSIYNAWRLDNKQADMKYMQLIEFEYRSDGAVKATHGGAVLATFPANTGNAATASYIALPDSTPACQWLAVRRLTSKIRTLRIVTLGCLLDLTPPRDLPRPYGTTLPGRKMTCLMWRREAISAEAELSDSADGYPATTVDDRDALLTYAARYTEVREELLLRLSADEAARRTRP